MKRIEDYISKNEYENYEKIFREEFTDVAKYIFEFSWNFYVMIADLILLSCMFLLAWVGALPQDKLAFSGLLIVILNVILQAVKSVKLIEKRSRDWNRLGKEIRILNASKAKKWKIDKINALSKQKHVIQEPRSSEEKNDSELMSIFG